MELPQGVVTTNMQNMNVLIKALAMGLADFTVIDNHGEIRFATDGKHFMNAVEAKTRKNVYNLLHKFDDRMGQLIPVYGVIELESLYQIYKKLYDKHMEKEDFLRIIFWHCRFNDFIDTIYQIDGTAYAAQKELNASGRKTNFDNEIPRSGSEWNEYLKGKYGADNVHKNINSVDDVFSDPTRLKQMIQNMP